MELLNINCRLLTGQEVKVTVPGDTKIGEIKELIADECYLTPENQKLIFKGQMLEDGRNISSYNVSSGSTIHVVSNSPGPSPSGPQHSQGTGNPLDFGGNMPSNMSKLMNDFVKLGTSAGGSSGRDWAAAAENMKPLLMQGMQFAQQMAKGDKDFGQIASTLLSNMMGQPVGQPGQERSYNPGSSPSYSSGVNQTTVPEAGEKVTKNVEKDGRTQENKECDLSSSSAILTAKKAIDRAYSYSSKHLDSNSEVRKEEGHGTRSTNEENAMVDFEEGLNVIRDSNGIFLQEPKSLTSKLPWKMLERAESMIEKVNGNDAPKQYRKDIDGFVKRYNEVSEKASEIVNKVADWVKGNQAIKAETMGTIYKIFALQAALNAEFALITAVLSNKMLILEESVEGKITSSQSSQASKPAYDSTSSSQIGQVKPSDGKNSIKTQPEQGIESRNCARGSSSLDYMPTRNNQGHWVREGNEPNLMNMISSFGKFAEAMLQPPMPQVSIPASVSTAEDDVLTENTELRKLFNQYRNSTGFKSRMDQLAQKTKKLSRAYCSGSNEK